MGREIRRVPKDWKHPRKNDPLYYPGTRDGGYHPLHDMDYETAAEEWVKNLELWQKGKHPNQHLDYKWYWDYAGPPPILEFYRCKEYDTLFQSEPTYYQIYETMSAGTPVSPVFETLDELVAWCVKNGYSETQARQFAKRGWEVGAVATAKEFTKRYDV